MADKRATPDAPQDASAARGKKREAPTIDLTAGEMPPEPAADPAPAEAAAPAEQPPQSEPPPGPAKRGNRNIGALALAAGCGAVLAMLALFGVWLVGALPTGNQVSPGAAQDPAVVKQVELLTQRITALEAGVAKLPPADAGVADKLAAADNAMKSLGVALAALGRRTDDATANAAEARKAADTAVKAAADLQASVKDAAGVPRPDFEALQQRTAALETAAKATRDDVAKNSGNDQRARLALAAVLLRDAVMAGAPYVGELTAVKSLGGDDAALAALAPFAASGVRDKKGLANELNALVPAMLKISGAQAPTGGFLEKLEANAGRLVRVRPVNAPPGDDASSILARVEIDAASADIAATLADLGKLPDAVRAPAAAWIDKAKARQAALDAARQVAADAARGLGRP